MPKRFRPEANLEKLGDAPSYLNDLPQPTDAEFWRQIEWQFSSAIECLGMQAVQTQVEAAGFLIRSSSGEKNQWIDSSAHYAALPYIKGLDNEYLAQRFETIRVLCDAINTDIKTRRLTPEFLWRWGELNSAAGAIEAYSRLEPYADARIRAAIARDRSDKESRESWYAHQILRILSNYEGKGKKPIPRTQADRTFAELVHGIAFRPSEEVSDSNRAIAENEKTRKWCKDYINKQTHIPHDWRDALKSTYKNIKKERLRELEKDVSPAWPDLKFEFPQV